MSNKSLQITCKDLDEAYKKAFNKTAGFPHFKSKEKSKASYPIDTENFYFVDETHVFVSKIGIVKCKTDLKFPIGRGHKFINPRISFRNGKWFVSFTMEYEPQKLELTDKVMGIDLGIKELAVIALDGEKIVYHNINKSSKIKELERKRTSLQRSISRKYEQNRVGRKYVKTKNIIRQEEQLRKINARLTGIRNNYIHQTTHELASMLPKMVIMEDLNVAGMMKNRHLSKAIQDAKFAEFIWQMKYKCEMRGIEFVQVGRFFPSSKTCSCCGAIKKNLKLSDRKYVCDECGFTEDRDFNAALNLSRYVVSKSE